MISRNTIVVVMLALTGVAWAQIGEPVGFPTQGTVTGNNVYIRSKGERTAYTCGKVGKSAVVVVVAREGDWLQIVPPEGVFSIISKNFVQRTADDWGTVTGTPVHIRAGSSPNVGGTQRHDAIQGYLSEGHEVEIIGEGSDYYKIVPPGGAYVWISANYVRLPGQPAPEEPAGERAALVDDRADDDDDSPVAPEPLSDAGQQCIAADNMLIAELQKDIADQQLGSVLEMYEAIDAPPGSGLQGTLGRRITYVQSAIKRQNDAARVAEMAARTVERRAELERQLARGGQAKPVGYAAQGVLSVSHLYADRFLLRDPATNADVAYVRGVVGMDLSPYVGQMVGVSGRATYDPDTRLNIVAVTKVAILAAVQPGTAPMTPAEPAPAVPVTPAVPITPAPSEAAPSPPAPPAEFVGDGPPPPVPAEPISLQPDRATVEPPPEPEKEPESPAKPDGPGSDEMPDEPVRPPRLIRPHEPDQEADPDAMPDRPSRPAKPSVDRARPPAEDNEADAPPAPPSAPAETEDEPEKPKVEMHRPLPPEGLPIEEDQDGDSDIDTSEYE